MNRRQFMKTTGISLGAFLIQPSVAGSRSVAGERGIINLPDEVLAISDKATIPLALSGDRTWIGNDVRVHLAENKGVVAIDVQSPSENLKSVLLRWKFSKPGSTRVMGDHWERSYGDLRWSPIEESRILPWYFMELAENGAHGFGVRTGAGAMCAWQAGTGSLQLVLDLRSGGAGVRLGERTLHAAEIVARRGKEGESPFAATAAFCKLMCDAPRFPKEPVYGINDWYFTYGDNSEDLILQHVRLTADLAAQNSNRPFCVIDAGWAKKSPRRSKDPAWGDDFATWNSNFGDMGALASKIRSHGMRPGIWVRPLCASVNDDRSLLLPSIPGRQDPNQPILDPTIPENMERITGYFLLYRKWGYDLIKHDFTTFDILGKWGFQMMESRDITSNGWKFNDGSVTNAEIIRNLYRAIREASGDTVIIACNTVGHLAAGLSELQRIGDDTSGMEWERTRKMGVNTLGFRIAQHGSFYSVDGDCVGLTTKVPWEKNRQWMQLLAESGTPLFISAQKEAVGDAQRESIRQSFVTASKSFECGEPLDWLANPFPAEWRLRGKIVRFSWD